MAILITEDAVDTLVTEIDEPLKTDEPVTAVTFNPATGITVADITVNSSTSMVVDLDIATDAPVGPVAMTVTTRIGTSAPIPLPVTGVATEYIQSKYWPGTTQQQIRDAVAAVATAGGVVIGTIGSVYVSTPNAQYGQHTVVTINGAYNLTTGATHNPVKTQLGL